MSRRGLQVVLGILATVAVLSGLAGVLFGPSALPSGEDVNATVDSEYRFTNAFWLVAGLVVWWAVPRVERATMILRVVLGTAFVGGLARLLAIAASGLPHPVFLAALTVELVLVPIALTWQAAVARAAAAAA